MSSQPTIHSQTRLTGWRAAAIWLVTASGIVAIGFAEIFNPADWIVVLMFVTVIVSFGVVGAVLVVRLPGNLVGWLLWGSGLALVWSVAGIAYTTRSAGACGGCWPATVPLALLTNMAFAPIAGIVGIFIPLLFPDGRLPSPRWRPVAWLGLFSIALLVAAIAFTPGPISSGVENPIGIDAFSSSGGAGTVATLAGFAVAMILALTSVVWRFRQADAVQRQQLRWFGYATVAMLACLVVGLSRAFDWTWVVLIAGLGLIPLATGIAILRYRLYDLDRLVSRTIAYAVVSGGLILVYLAINLGLTTVFSSLATGNSVVVAASTLAVAALFTPLRRRVQRIVDRRFDRARYDAELTASAFSERLRNEVDIQTVAAELDTTVRRAMAPGGVGIWLREARR